MDYFPIFLDLRGQRVLVAGGGAVAERKLRLLLSAGARPQVVALALNEQVATWLDEGRIEWLGGEYRAEWLDGARLAFAASSDAELNLAVHRDAEARGIPVNVVDDREHCRFITPAIVDRGPIQVAISSGGASPVLARRIRGWIERLLPAGLGKVAAAAGRLRGAASALPLERRRQFWDETLDDAAVSAWSAKPEADIERELRVALDHERPRAGHVTLVGAGPGRADLLTLRALQALGQADVILHDRLVSEEILDLARRDAEFIDVGKRDGDHHATQAEIHRLLLEHARAGRHVVRLKGGDPFVFGRGGEELEVLRDAGIDYEVVPGVTAASGCAAFAGIPLTHRELSQALTLITGHVKPGGEPPPWRELAGKGRTLAVYMGVKQAASLRRQLLAAGLSPALPAALVADGTRDTQRVLTGTIDDLPALAARAPSRAPGLFIIGEVAALGARLGWFEGESTERVAA